MTERNYEGFKNRIVHCQKLRAGEETGAFVSIIKRISLSQCGTSSLHTVLVEFRCT